MERVRLVQEVRTSARSACGASHNLGEVMGRQRPCRAELSELPFLLFG
jgi:hypothetical protein